MFTTFSFVELERDHAAHGGDPNTLISENEPSTCDDFLLSKLLLMITYYLYANKRKPRKHVALLFI